MRISNKPIDEQHYDLIVLTVECPYCCEVRKYRTVDNNTFNAVCKCCGKEFIVDHEFDDCDLIKKDYYVYYIGDRIPEYKGFIGIVTSDSIYDEIMQEESIWVTYPDGKSFCFDIWDLRIERKRNKEIWKKYEGG